jgi:hypothetical protein
MPIVGVQGRVRIPPGVLTVIGSGGYTVSLARVVSASEKRPSDADSRVADTEPFHSKSGIYASDSEPNDVNADKHCLDKGG